MGRTDFFFNVTVAELIGTERLAAPRVQELIDIMQINTSWRINAISDGQRRRCQLLDSLAEEKRVYILDEITTDLDLFAREGLLRFLRHETEGKGARCCKMEDLKEYHDLVSQGMRVPLYSLMREW